MEVYILELSNGLKITETLGGNGVERFVSSLGFPFIRSTNEAGETYQVVDTVGEIYNLPALPTEFILESITNQIYLSSNGDELIENSLHLKPFRSENLDDRVISIGNITAGSNFVNVALDVSGINSVLINGTLREKYLPDYFNFTPVITGIKVLIIYAKDDSQIFYLAEGIEAPEAVEPVYVGLFVARLIVSTTGVIIQEEDSTYKNKSDDTIAPIILNNDTATWVFGDRTNYDITATGLVTAPILAGFKYADSSPAIWNGKKSIIRNRTGFPLLFKKVTPPADTLVYFPFKQDYTIADGKDAQVIYDNNNEVALIEIGGGGASFPTGTDGQVYEIDNSLPEKIKPSNRLSDLEVHQIEITTATSISTNTIGTVTGKSQNGRNVIIKNGINTINIVCEYSSEINFVASYMKAGNANITFIPGGISLLVQVDGTNVLNGAIGSTACLTRVGDTYYLQISNR